MYISSNRTEKCAHTLVYKKSKVRATYTQPSRSLNKCTFSLLKVFVNLRIFSPQNQIVSDFRKKIILKYNETKVDKNSCESSRYFLIYRLAGKQRPTAVII